MRTTLTIDEDVAVQLERLREREKTGLKALVNRILREGLRRLDEPGKPAERYETPSTDLGQCLVGDVDDVSEVLSVAEGDDFR